MVLRTWPDVRQASRGQVLAPPLTSPQLQVRGGPRRTLLAESGCLAAPTANPQTRTDLLNWMKSWLPALRTLVLIQALYPGCYMQTRRNWGGKRERSYRLASHAVLPCSGPALALLCPGNQVPRNLVARLVGSEHVARRFAPRGGRPVAWQLLR